MTDINWRPDDTGIQRLRRDNAQADAPRAVTPVAPYPRVDALSPPQGQPVRPPRERRSGRDRRRRQEPVLLDTRSKHDRRNRARGGDGDDGAPPSGGIDVKA